jgi:hypothetical protein
VAAIRGETGYGLAIAGCAEREQEVAGVGGVLGAVEDDGAGLEVEGLGEGLACLGGVEAIYEVA